MNECAINTSLLGRELTETEATTVQKSIDAYNTNGVQNLLAMTIGPNFEIRNGHMTGFTALFNKNSPVYPDLLKTGEYGKARVTYRVQKTDRDGNYLNNETYRTEDRKQALHEALPLSVAEVEQTFGAHAMNEDRMFSDAELVPTLGASGAAGVATYTKVVVAEVEHDLIVAEVVPQAFAQQADAHIDEAYKNGLTIGELLSNQTVSGLADAMGTASADVFGVFPNSSGYTTSAQFVASRCGRAAATRVADVFGLQFEPADMVTDTRSVGSATVPEAMAEAFTNILVPVGDQFVVFYCEMVSAQMSPTIPYADHALTGWKLIMGETPETSPDKPTIFKASAFGNAELAWAYPFSAPSYCTVDEIPENELSVEGIEIENWRDHARMTLVFQGLTAAVSPTFNVGASLSGESLEHAAHKHTQRFRAVDEQCRSDDGSYVGSIVTLKTRVMRVAELSPRDRKLYQGDTVINEGEFVAERMIQAQARQVVNE